MPTPERRQFPRTTLEKLAYLRIEPDNGGIVLNVSPDGLGFHSIAAVEKNGPLRFTLLEQNRRIAACGELTWTDEIQKIGGVRFTTMTTEAREQIQNWISQPALPPETTSSTLGSAILKAFPKLRLFRLDAHRDSIRPSVFATAFPRVRLRLKIKLSGFARGLVTGLLLSAVLASIFLLVAHRRDIGVSLIHLGEGLAGQRLADERSPDQHSPDQRSLDHSLSNQGSSNQRSGGQGLNAESTVPKLVAEKTLPQLPAITSPMSAPSSTRIQPPPPLRPVASPDSSRAQPTTVHSAKPAQPSIALNKSQPSAFNPQKSASVPPRTIGNSASHPRVSDAGVAPTGAPAPIPLAATSSPTERSAANQPSAMPQPASTGTIQTRESAGSSIVSLPQMFFEVGKSKDELHARDLGDRVAQLGLRPSVVQKGHLWMSAFYVLVGPYTDPDEATKTDQNLRSHGYRPRPFERGSRSFSFVSELTLAGTKLPIGDLTVNWESYVTEAKVKFAQGNSVMASAEGQWVKRPARYQRNEYVYVKTSSGSKLLREIHFSGLDRALVFRDSS